MKKLLIFFLFGCQQPAHKEIMPFVSSPGDLGGIEGVMGDSYENFCTNPPDITFLPPCENVDQACLNAAKAAYMSTLNTIYYDACVAQIALNSEIDDTSQYLQENFANCFASTADYEACLAATQADVDFISDAYKSRGTAIQDRANARILSAKAAYTTAAAACCD